LEGFIKRFVQCGQCNNPETDIVLTKRETIELVCKACGAVTQVDMRHKLTTFILKNPPVNKDKGKKCVWVLRVARVLRCVRRCADALRRGEQLRVGVGACAPSLHARSRLGPCALNPGACVR
jgi:hypothetical protein